jgi:hypothetical protein
MALIRNATNGLEQRSEEERVVEIRKTREGDDQGYQERRSYKKEG